ncbi:helix-turn-helix domain-containing protein [Aliiroseovarius sp. 2305UL8-7]|uniref:helix-turn-helix domain-containing protein n=1 Tax=Aliiroseovarius conchicola TaxID=3121637 RepID=UPI00352828E0
MAGTLHSVEYKRLVEALVEARRSIGISQASLAERIGRHPSFVAKVELIERRIDVVEYLIWASAVSSDPIALLKDHLPLLPTKIPR